VRVVRVVRVVRAGGSGRQGEHPLQSPHGRPTRNERDVRR